MQNFFYNSSRIWLAGLLCAILLLPGCSGCNSDPDPNNSVSKEKDKNEKDKKSKDKKKRKPDFSIEEIVIKPNDRGKKDDDKKSVSLIGYVKPGHWATGSMPVTANHFDFQGNLVARCLNSRLQQIPTENTNYLLTMSRPISLAKSERKEIEVSYYVPRRTNRSMSVLFQHDFQNRSGRRMDEPKMQSASLMDPYQYYLVVLSDSAAEFKYLDFLPSVNVPFGKGANGDTPTDLRFYRLALPTIEGFVPVPDYSLNWTSIAYVVWDDLDPNLMNPNQQRALIDWIYFGGQLIVNGPSGYSKLQNSFLQSYLPYESCDLTNLVAEDVAQLNDHWSIGSRKDARKLQLTDQTKVAGMQMQLSGRGKFVKDTGNLVAESQIGRGRIVVTGFNLKSRQIKNWKSFDNFFNGCLLRRPARKFSESTQFFGGDYEVNWTNNTGQTDPMLSSTLRYISRDLGMEGTPIYIESLSDGNQTDRSMVSDFGTLDSFENRRRFQTRNTLKDDWHYGGFRNSAQSGVAGWNDDSGVAIAARETLRESAGIEPPSSSFVLKMLAGYLFVLVPLNWAFFRLIGRLEWAWIAAPIIAICGAIIVVRMASLDIGFARSNNEIAVLEMYGGFSRGHLTRYSALYTSLSSNYELEFDSDSAQAQPFAAGHQSQNSNTLSEVELRREKTWKLKSFRVQSNSTAFLHSEQMYDAGGTFILEHDNAGNYQVINTTGIALQDVGIVRRDEEGIWKAWIGELNASDQPQRVNFQLEKDGEFRFDEWNESHTTQNIKRVARETFTRLDVDKNDWVSRTELADYPEMLEQFTRYDSTSREQDYGVLDQFEFERCFLATRKQDTMSLGRLFDMVATNLALSKDQCRMIGWSKEMIPGTHIYPEATQNNARTFVIVHLESGALPDPTQDVNSHYDFLHGFNSESERFEAE